jgi:hypothetical protein
MLKSGTSMPPETGKSFLVLAVVSYDPHFFKKEQHFFFEKKKQKTFYPFHEGA